MSTGILITTRNRGEQLAYGLESLRYCRCPIVVVDDGSDDTTALVLAEADIEMQVISIDRGGGYRGNPSEVWNVGHRNIDTDVVIEQGGEVCHLTDCVADLSALCRPGLVALARVYHGTPDEYERLRGLIESQMYDFQPDLYPATYRTNGDRWKVPMVGGFRLYCGRERPAPFMFCGAIHREDFEAVGGYDESLPRRNDEDLANRLIKRGVHFVFSGKAVAFHLEHGKS